jgi:hypothetical protein
MNVGDDSKTREKFQRVGVPKPCFWTKGEVIVIAGSARPPRRSSEKVDRVDRRGSLCAGSARGHAGNIYKKGKLCPVVYTDKG